jgi:peptidoglycan/xylan/chitin deacetylase (PgdA/CDA1 family)
VRAILTYHSIDASGSPVSVDEGAFRRHVCWIAGGGVPVVTLEEIVRMPADRGHALAVTFDDAFASFGTTAWPLLRDHGIPATLFVATGHVGGANDWGGTDGVAIPRLPLLGWDALGRLAEEGVALGGHTRSHPDLRRLEGARLEDEVAGCAAEIEARTGRAPRSFAYPYGAWDDRVAAVVGRSFALACTTVMRPLAPGSDPLRLPRLDAYYFRDNRRLEGWGSAGFRRYVALRAAVRRVRGSLAALGSWG